MIAAPSIAIDLPQDPGLGRRQWEASLYNDLAYLQQRQDVPSELMQNIAVVETCARPGSSPST